MTGGRLKIGQIMLDFDVSITVNQNKLFSKQSYCQWYEMPQLMWRHRIGSSPTNRWAIQWADPKLIYDVTYGLRRIVLFIKSFVWRFRWWHVIIQNQRAHRCETIFWPPYTLTPGSIYRTIFWPRGQYIVTIFWPPSRYFDPPPNIVYKTVLLFMDNY